MSAPIRHWPQPPASTPLVEMFVNEALTTPAAVRLHGRLTDALTLRPAQMVVDLAGCPTADALALDVLLNAHRRAYHLGSRLVLRAPSERVLRAIEMAHLDRVFDITSARSPHPPPYPRANATAGQPQ